MVGGLRGLQRLSNALGSLFVYRGAEGDRRGRWRVEVLGCPTLGAPQFLRLGWGWDHRRLKAFWEFEAGSFTSGPA